LNYRSHTPTPIRERIETRELLIEHKQVRFVDQRRDELDSLLVAVRERVD
jgi:hypothetical protein